MSDWFGGRNPVEQMTAGNDLLMPGTTLQTKTISEALNSGKLDVKMLDRNVETILNIDSDIPFIQKLQGFRKTGSEK